MAGILNNKERVMDTLITTEGKRQAAAGHMRIYYASFTDRHTFYQDDGEGNIDGAEHRMMLEAVSRIQDKIVIETDQEGMILPIKVAVSGVLDINGSSIQDLLVSDNKLQAKLAGKSLQLANSSNFINLGSTFMNSISNHYEHQELLMTPDMFETDNGFDMQAQGPRAYNKTDMVWFPDDSEDAAHVKLGDVITSHSGIFISAEGAAEAKTDMLNESSSSITFQLQGTHKQKSDVGYSMDPLVMYDVIDTYAQATQIAFEQPLYDTLPRSLESLDSIWSTWRVNHLPHYQYLPPIRKFDWGTMKFPEPQDIDPAQGGTPEKIKVVYDKLKAQVDALVLGEWPSLKSDTTSKDPATKGALTSALTTWYNTALSSEGGPGGGFMWASNTMEAADSEYAASLNAINTITNFVGTHELTALGKHATEEMTGVNFLSERKKNAILDAMYSVSILAAGGSSQTAKQMITNFNRFCLRAEIVPSIDQSTGRQQTSVDNNMVIQFTESREDGTFEKLALIDYGELDPHDLAMDPDDNNAGLAGRDEQDVLTPPRMFFVGKMFTDGYDHPTFVNIFTVIMETRKDSNLIMDLVTFERVGKPPGTEVVID